MLTGSTPYERENSLAALYAHVHDPPPPLTGDAAGLEPAVDDSLARAMAKKPDDRYPSAGDFARDAVAALHGVRYAGRQTVVATGEAAPAEGDVAVAPHRNAPAPVPPVPHSGMSRVRRYSWAAAAAVVVGAGIAATVALTSGGSSPPPAPASYSTLLRPVPANWVTGSGDATVRLSGDTATVRVDTNGLVAAPHLMHIHGGTGRCPSASDARPYNGHTVVGAAEGNAVYGGVVTSLTEHGSTSAGLDLVPSLYPSSGTIRYQRTVHLRPGVAGTIRDGHAVIVVHGIDYDGSGRYDSYLGTDSQFAGLPVEESAPALCGPLVPAQTARVRGTATYVASLRVYGGVAVSNAFGPAFLCHPSPVPSSRARPA